MTTYMLGLHQNSSSHVVIGMARNEVQARVIKTYIEVVGMTIQTMILRVRGS